MSFYKNNPKDKVWWQTPKNVGEHIFSFDQKVTFNLFSDYPWKMSKEQVEIFDKENPFWADFFRDRKEGYNG